MNDAARPVLVILCGVSFAGKTTLGRALALARGWEFVSFDELHGQSQPQIASLLAAGRSVVYDDVNRWRSQRDGLRALAKEQGATACIVHVDTSVDEARQRWLLNQRQPTRNHVRPGDFLGILAQFQPPLHGEPVIRYHPKMPFERWVARAFPPGEPPSIGMWSC